MKSLLQSKTFWLATVQAVAGALVIYSTAYPQIGILVILKSGLDIGLRIYTKEQVGL